MYYDEIQCLFGLIAFCVGSTLALQCFTVKCMFWETVGSLSVTCQSSVSGLSADSQLTGPLLHNYRFHSGSHRVKDNMLTCKGSGDGNNILIQVIFSYTSGHLNHYTEDNLYK